MPNNHKNYWKCKACRNATKPSSATTTTCTSSCSESEGSDDDDTVITVGISQGTMSTTGALAILTDAHFDLINDPLGWPDCDIIQQAHILLQQENPTIEGFQRTTLGPVRNFNIVSGEFNLNNIQILHTGRSHWACVSSIGCLSGHVNLYDSLYDDGITQEVEQQTNDMLGGRLVLVKPVSVQQQNNGSDCGVFAIAFATCLVFEVDPTHITFDVPKMRPYLATCLRNSKISLLPSF